MQKRNLILISCVMLILLSLAAMLYPIISQNVSRNDQLSEINQHLQSQQAVPTEVLNDVLAQAEAYNSTLSEGEPLSDDDYNAALNVAGNGMMGYITIPKINVILPIYHGTSASVLNKGAGHMAQSSLPVGGKNTHSVITAHSGMAKDPMFSDLPQVKEGDCFTIQVSGRILEYRVTTIQTVLPSEADAVRIQPGKDLCTLITCVPYGINTHRLLVTGERVVSDQDSAAETAPQSEVSETPSAPAAAGIASRYFIAIAIGLAISAVIIAAIMFFGRKRDGR